MGGYGMSAEYGLVALIWGKAQMQSIFATDLCICPDPLLSSSLCGKLFNQDFRLS